MAKLPIPEYVNLIREKIGDDEYIPVAIRMILSENGIKEYPINAFEIAKKLGFTIKYAEFKDSTISGILWDGVEEAIFGNEGYKRVMIINSKESPERQLFTVAHEIGHFMLHCNENSNFYERYISAGNKSVDPEEKRMEDKADYFAANLLLPEDILNRYIKVNNLKNRRNIEYAVASSFFVEKETVSRRLDEIGYE